MKINNSIIKLLMFFLLLSTFFISCDDYLDETPDNRQEIKEISDLSELLVTAYSEGAYNFIEWRTDNVEGIKQNDQELWLTENYRWDEITSYEDQDSPSWLWDETYYAIAHSNQALEELKTITVEDKKQFDAVKGEALLTRAYNHFILASVFCQAYNKATSSIDLGIPYVTSPEKELLVDYERGTLEDTYTLVEKDLLEGLPLISNDYYIGNGKYHFNKEAAYAFASRFFLWKGDYENCIKYSNMLLGEGVINTSFCRYYSEIFEGSSGEAMSYKFMDPEAPYNLLLVRKETLSAITRYYNGYQPTDHIFDGLYGSTIQGGLDERDFRWGYQSGAVNPPKYTELFRYTTSTTGFPYFIMPELRAEEVILNRMEAYVKMSRIDEALADYNVYAPTRYRNGGQLTLEEIKKFYKVEDVETAMMEFIIDERQKEFLREGMRWWDIKRYNLSITHKDIHGNVFELKSENDPRKAVQISAKAIANGIQANPN